jgi:hypothetical protein
VLLVVVSETTASTEHVVSLTTSEVTAYSPDDSLAAPFYLLQVSMPAGITDASIHEAYLELYADVSAVTVDVWQNQTPVVEMYVLKSPLSGELSPSQFLKPSGMVRNVRIGLNRRVRLNVTEAIRYYANNPEKNYGIVLGSFRGYAEGRFTLRSDRFDGGAVARLTILTTD